MEAILPIYLKNRFGLSPMAIGAVFGGTVLAFTVASFGAGVLSDKYPRKRMVFMCVGLFSFVVMTPLLTAFNKLWVTCAVLVLMGLFQPLMNIIQLPALNEVIEQKYAGRLFGAGGALSNISWGSGSLSGPIIVSMFVDAFGIQVALLIPAGLTLAFAVCFSVSVLFWRQTDYKRVEEQQPAVLETESIELEEQPQPNEVAD